MTEKQRERWEQIKKDFMRAKALGGDDMDTGSKIVAQLAGLTEGVNGIVSAANTLGAPPRSKGAEAGSNGEAVIARALEGLKEAIAGNPAKVEVINQPVPGVDKVLRVLADTIENTIFPLVRSMDKKLEIDLRTHEKMSELSHQLRELEAEIRSGRFQAVATGSKAKSSSTKKKLPPKN